MNFNFNISKIFPETITKIQSQDAARYDHNLMTIVDLMGEASQIAQKLHRPVTTSGTFINSDQTLYIMSNFSENNGNGTVVGLLKTGRKKLFLLDKQGIMNELNPICVLDFYIHERFQRMGMGKILFSHFLEDEKLGVNKIAIDRPSDKFLRFLKKYYHLDQIIPQVNNFVIFSGFFENEENSKKKSSFRHAYENPALPNQWDSMVVINSATDDSNIFRDRSKQSTISCLYADESLANASCDRSPTSFAQINRPVPTQEIAPGVVNKQNQFCSPNAASKLSHHQLW